MIGYEVGRNETGIYINMTSIPTEKIGPLLEYINQTLFASPAESILEINFEAILHSLWNYGEQNTINLIKLVRVTQPGLSLKQAKDIVDNFKSKYGYK